MLAIQYVESAKSPAEARELLNLVRQQEGCIGGSVIYTPPGHPHCKVVTFFHPNIVRPGDPLPDGCRVVEL